MSVIDRIKRVTTKQWVMVAAGGGGAALLVNHFYAKDNSILSKLWRGIHGDGGVTPQGGGMHAHSAPMQLPSSAVFAEPTIGPMPPEVWAPMYGGVPYFAHFYSPHGSGVQHRHHIVGSPKPYDGIKSNVPPPGSRGVVSVTPPASTDPGQGGQGSDQPTPCGPGLYYDAATGRCLPYPSTPPYGGAS